MPELEDKTALDLSARVNDSGWLDRKGLRALVADLWAENARLRAQQDEALALHKPERILTVGGSDTMCSECRKRPANAYDVVWPCATVRVLSRTEDGTDG